MSVNDELDRMDATLKDLQKRSEERAHNNVDLKASIENMLNSMYFKMGAVTGFGTAVAIYVLYRDDLLSRFFGN